MTSRLNLKSLSGRIIWGAFAFVLLSIGAITAMWFAGAAQVREQIARVGQNFAGDGGQFTVQTLRVTGFPFAYEAELGNLALAGRDARGTWEWRADRARLTMSPWLGRNIVFDLSGNHRLRTRLGRLPLDLEIAAQKAPGEIQLGSAAAPALYKILPENIRAKELTTGAEMAADRASFQLFIYPPQERRPANNTQAAAGVLVELAGVGLPPAWAKFLGPKLAKLATEIQVLGDVPVPVDRRNIARFREAGGSVEVKSLALEWGPARIDGSGTLTLDAGLQPEASFAARMTGFEETADALVAAGLIRAQEAQGVKLLLSLMARRSDPGRGAEIRVPITIQDRTVYVGPARLARLPQIRW